jgi:hypothetical protein
LTDPEARETYGALAAMLMKFELGELLQRVEAYLREGKPEEREIVQYEVPQAEVHGLPFQGHFPQQRRPGPRTRYLGVVEYSPQERVQILADAILHAVVFARQMEHEVWGYLGKSTTNPDDVIVVESVRVVSEQPDGELIVRPLRRETPGTDLQGLQGVLQRISEEARR